MKFFKKIVLTLLLSAITIGISHAQQDSIKISLITCYPGPGVYELYGHTAIRVQRGTDDTVFNYGMFSFSEPNFVYRFVKGDANYMLVAYPFYYFLPDYISRNSKVVEQELNLTQEESSNLLNQLIVGAEPQNRSYRYNYIYDNCSTRPRDIIEKIVGKSLSYNDSIVKSTTFRKEMAHYNANYPWQQFGIDLALGLGLDCEISYHEQMFMPIALMNSFSGATIIREGKIVPLVKQTNIIFDAAEEGSINPPTPWHSTPATFSLALLLLTTIMTIWDIKRKKITKIYDTVLYLIYALAGCVIFFLVFISSHAATSPNLVLIWLNPILLAFAVLIWIKRAKKLLYWLHFINFATLFTLLCAWYWLPQSANIAFFALIGCSLVRSLNYIIVYRQCERKSK